MTTDFVQSASTPAGGFVLPAPRRPKPPRGETGRAFETRFDRIHDHVYSIGLFVPTSGALGIWGPSTIACARLAAEEINRAGGLLGQEVRLRLVDAADERMDLVVGLGLTVWCGRTSTPSSPSPRQETRQTGVCRAT